MFGVREDFILSGLVQLGVRVGLGKYGRAGVMRVFLSGACIFGDRWGIGGESER